MITNDKLYTIFLKPQINPTGLNYKKKHFRIGRMTAIKIDVGDGGGGKKDPGGKVSSSAVTAGGLKKQPGLTTTYEIVLNLPFPGND